VDFSALVLPVEYGADFGGEHKTHLHLRGVRDFEELSVSVGGEGFFDCFQPQGMREIPGADDVETLDFGVPSDFSQVHLLAGGSAEAAMYV